MNVPKPRRQRRRANQPGESHASTPGHAREPLNNAPTTTLDVVDYTVTRALELRSLREATQQRNGNRRVYQQLSWHSRRRTMSHSAHRMPLRLRLAHARQLTSQNAHKPPGPRGKTRLRKHRKKARFLQALRKLRCLSEKLLETHIWHAKRFHMGYVGDKKVAEYCSDRGYRSAYRAANRACVICDITYFEIIEIAGETPAIKDLLRHHMCFEDGRKVSTDPVTNGFRWVTDLVILDAGRAIAPCDILWRGTVPTLWMWVRPEAVKAVINSLSRENVRVKRLARPPVRFRLIGPRSGQIVGSVLKCTNAGMEFITRSRDSRCLPSGCVFAGMSQNPWLSFPPKTVGKFVAEVGECEGDLMNVFKGVADSGLWELSRREALYEDAVKQGANKQMCDIPFILLQRSAPSGYDLLLPQGWGNAFWISLMYGNNSRAIGVNEYTQLRFEHLQPSFPDDYPDSAVARRLLKERAEGLRRGHGKRPRGKRVNYEKLGTTSPWFADLISVARSEMGMGRSKRLKINEISVARGRSRLCGLLDECCWIIGDAQPGRRRATLDRTDDDEVCVTFARVVIRAKRGIPKRYGVLCESEGSRAIGYLVDGGYCIGEGVGIGTGFVAISALKRLIGKVANKRSVSVLYRNPSSPVCRPAHLGVLES